MHNRAARRRTDLPGNKSDEPGRREGQGDTRRSRRSATGGAGTRGSPGAKRWRDGWGAMKTTGACLSRNEAGV